MCWSKGMFTGLIESVGTIVTSTPMKGGVRVRIATSLAPELTLGESLAVNGVCLTVIAHDAETADADIGPETLQVTTLGRLQPGSLVNLERSMRADARMERTSSRGTSMRSDGSSTCGRTSSSIASP